MTRDEFLALKSKVDDLEKLFVDYHDVKGKSFAEAKKLLQDFHLLLADEIIGEPIDDTKQIVAVQFPEFRPGIKLLRGMGVVLFEDLSRLSRNG